MTRARTILLVAAGMAAIAVLTLNASALQEEKPKLGYKDTPMLPGGKWHVHDGDRPQPPIVTPGTCGTQESPGTPPSDAVVLFDGKDLARWHVGNNKPAGWKIEDGAMIVTPQSQPGGGAITSNDEFGDCQLHIEWSAPNPPRGKDQGRGNSGVFFFGLYEIQVLDNYENITYPDGQAGAIYGQYPPLVNASRKPGEWQTYDIVFTAPRFAGDGSTTAPAYATVLHNGVLVQNHTAILGPMIFRGLPRYKPHGPKGPISLQDHGDPVRYRNIWVRALKNIEGP